MSESFCYAYPGFPHTILLLLSWGRSILRIGISLMLRVPEWYLALEFLNVLAYGADLAAVRRTLRL